MRTMMEMKTRECEVCDNFISLYITEDATGYMIGGWCACVKAAAVSKLFSSRHEALSFLEENMP